MDRAGTKMNAPSRMAFRFNALVLGAALAAQAVWILLAELSRPGIDRLPTDLAVAEMAAKARDQAARAARIGAIRGDLWAESAFTFASLILADSPDAAEPAAALDQADTKLDRALSFAPHRSDAWLLLAALASRYRTVKIDPTEALEVSYYTAPSELRLLPLRLLVAVRLDVLVDPALQDFIRRDLRLLLAHGQQGAITRAYRSASPAGGKFLEQALGEIDPALLKSLRPSDQNSK